MDFLKERQARRITAKNFTMGETENLQVITLESLKEFLTETLSIYTSLIVEGVREAFKGNYQTPRVENDTELSTSDGEKTDQMGDLKEEKQRNEFKMEGQALVEIPIQMPDKFQPDFLLQDGGFNIWPVGQIQCLSKEEIVFMNKRNRKGSSRWITKILLEERVIKKSLIQRRVQKFTKIKAGGRALLKGEVFGKRKMWKKRKKKKRLIGYY